MATEITRSFNGCWSCHLRKKTCDQRHPVCTECMVVGLECHAFGDQAEWMDRGGQQKAQAAKMKQIIKTRRTSIKRRQTQTTSGATTPARIAGSSYNESPSYMSTPITQHPFTENTTQGMAYGDMMQITPRPSPSYHHGGDLGGTVDPLPSMHGTSMSGFQSTSAFDELTFLSDHHFDPDLPGLDSDNSTTTSPGGMRGNLVHKHHETLMLSDLDIPHSPGTLPRGYHSTPRNVTIKAITPTPPTPMHTPTNMDYLTTPCTTPTNGSMLPVTNIQDAILFAHYLEKAFHWQFRFCSSSPSADRSNTDFNQGHYIWLMSVFRPLYLASLALSSSHLTAFQRISAHEGFGSGFSTGHTGAEDPSSGMARYENATQELQRHMKASSLHNPADDVAMLACIVSFITSSFLHPTKIDWTAHLRAGIALIGPWISQQLHAPQSQQLQQQLAPKTPEEASRTFFTASLIRFKILSSLTSTFSPALAENYKQLLNPNLSTPFSPTDNFQTNQQPIINLEPVSGCQNWVFSLLLDVYALRDWKRSTRAAGLLSLWDLTAKANVIQTELEQRIAWHTASLLNQNHINFRSRSRSVNPTPDPGRQNSLSLQPDTPSVSAPMAMDMDTPTSPRSNNQHEDPTTRSNAEIPLVTHSFALAVSVLLEVIVSGAYPQLPEIKHKVARALETFVHVADIYPHGAELLESGALNWPLFVVGCVVEEREYATITRLFGGGGQRGMSVSTPKGMGGAGTPVSTPGGSGGGGLNQGGGGVVLELLERVWRAREGGELMGGNLNGFDYSGFGSEVLVA